MNERVERAVKFWNRMAEEAEDDLSALDRTAESLRKDVDYIFRTLPLRSDSEILDLCCGNGLLAVAVSDKVRHVVGIDMSPVMLEKANRMSKGKDGEGVSFVSGEVVSLPFKDDSFDYSYCMTSFHYFPNLDYAETVINEIIRVTRSTGMILLTDIPLKGCMGYHIWNQLRSRRDGYGSSFPEKQGKRGLVERLPLLLRRFTGKKVDSDEWLWYEKKFFQTFENEKFNTVQVKSSLKKGIIGYRFDVLFSNS